MKRVSTMFAVLALQIFIFAASAPGNESIASGHYRIGTLNESVHYRNNEDFNSSHDGFYIVRDRNVFGTYHNSEFEQSFFYARNRRLNGTFSFFYGVAFGYDFGAMPMVGLSAQINILKLTFTQQAAVIGLEFEVP